MATAAAGIGFIAPFISLASIDAHYRSSLAAMASCQSAAFASAGIQAFLHSGCLLGAVRHGDWIPHDRITQGNGDVDFGIILDRNREQETLRRMRVISHRLCGHFIIHRNDWFSESVMRYLGWPGAYGVRSSFARVYSWALPFAYLDLDTYSDCGAGDGTVLCVRESDDPTQRLHPSGVASSKPRILRSDILPISNCSFAGQTVSCPANPAAVLNAQYGADWRTPRDRNGNVL